MTIKDKADLVDARNLLNEGLENKHVRIEVTLKAVSIIQKLIDKE